MTQKTVIELKEMLSDLKEVWKFIQDTKTEVCTRDSMGSFSFYNSEHIGITPINKKAGSKLQYLENAIEKLDYLIEKQNIKRKEVSNETHPEAGPEYFIHRPRSRASAEV